jgi:hypothetical protein
VKGNVRSEVKPKTWIQPLPLARFDSGPNFFSKFSKEAFFVFKEEKGFINPRFLDARHCASSSRIEARCGTASRCMLASVKARQA